MMETKYSKCVADKLPVADPAGGLRGLQPPVLESSSAANVCLSTTISLLLNAASGLRNSVCNTVEPLYSGHHWGPTLWPL